MMPYKVCLNKYAPVCEYHHSVNIYERKKKSKATNAKQNNKNITLYLSIVYILFLPYSQNAGLQHKMRFTFQNNEYPH